MRIKKNSGAIISSESVQTTPADAYEEAINYIHSAISSLSNVAGTDDIARESIANLSVVLLDLKG